MPFLVDGSNLAGRAGSGAADRQAQVGVVRLLLPWARQRRQVVVVFDGPPNEQLAARYGPLTVRFAAPRSADDAILATLGDQPGEWCVVTDDRGLRDACGARGTRTMSARELLVTLGAILPSTGGEQREGPIDVADWEEWFRRGGG